MPIPHSVRCLGDSVTRFEFGSELSADGAAAAMSDQSKAGPWGLNLFLHF